MARPKFYAVRIGRDGPKIYTNWDDCKGAVSRFPNARHKSFMSRAEADAWLAEGVAANGLAAQPVHRPQPTANTSTYRRQPAPHPSLGPLVSASSSTSSPSNENGATNFGSSSPVRNSEPPATPATADLPHPLSREQLQVLERVKAGKSVFFTGSAGTGKSFLLRAIISHLRDSNGTYSTEAVAITASTGIASVNIDGCTIHSWSGIGLGNEEAEKIANKLKFQEKCAAARKRWKNVQTLVLDEISMIDGTLFDKLEEIGRLMRENDMPFGGIQLVLSGDFAQLPPVPGRDKEGAQVPALFAFEARSWDRCVGRPILLQKVFRQKNQEFVDMLNAMRFGQLDPKSIAAFGKLSRPIQYNDGIDPTELYPTRREVDWANTRRLHAIQAEPKTYLAHDVPGVSDDGQRVTQDGATRLLERLIAPKELTLKVGAQVMLIKNLRQGELVNGSQGVVVKWCTPGQARQDHTEISDEDPNKVFEENGANGKRHSESRGDAGTPYPLVKFTNGREMLCVPTDFTVLNGSGETEANRVQVPLILAWALSMHKSQGQTLQRVKVDLGKVFEKGQAYVALSRATTMETLQVLNFNPSKVKAHPKVVTWYANLMGVPPPRDEDDDMFDDDEEMWREVHGNWN